MMLQANDTDAENDLDLTTIVIVDAPAHGSVDTSKNDGTVDYTHDSSETTTDSFTYTIKDGSGAVSGKATVTITVTPVNDDPIAADDSDSTTEGGSVTMDIASNDTDAEGVCC